MNRFIYIAVSENLFKIYSFLLEKKKRKGGRKFKQVIRRISLAVCQAKYFSRLTAIKGRRLLSDSRGFGFGLVETTRPWNLTGLSMERHKVTEIVNFEKPIFRRVPHRKEVVRYHSFTHNIFGNSS